jgi:hypothetical protein
MYSLIEYLAATESKDFNYIDSGMRAWATGFLSSYFRFNGDLNKNLDLYHEGDCTNQNHACNLCVLEGILTGYRKYVEKYKENNP